MARNKPKATDQMFEGEERGMGTDIVENEEQEIETADNGKTTIKPNTEKWAKTDGKAHTDDFIGHTLAGLTLDQVKHVAEKVGVDHHKYDHLNVGQQRMNLGNRLRTLVKPNDKGTHEDAIALITEHTNNHKAVNAAAKPKVPVQVDAVEEAA